MKGSRRLRTRAVVAASLAAGALAIAAAALAFDNTTSISIANGTGTTDPTPGKAALYPSPIAVSGVSGTISAITVKLHQFDPSSAMNDFDMLLVGPTTAKVILMSDAGISCIGACPDGDIVINDSGPPMPLNDCPSDPGPCNFASGGPWHPTNYNETSSGPFGCSGEAEPDLWPNPGPGSFSQASPSLNATFVGTAPNGTWNLYVVDDCGVGGATSTITGGWSVAFGNPTAVKLASLDARAHPGAIVVSWRTGSENDTLGFDVYRSSGPVTTKLNSKLIRAKAAGRVRGASYRLVDRSVSSGVSYTYRIEVVHLSGSREPAGSVATRAAS